MKTIDDILLRDFSIITIQIASLNFPHKSTGLPDIVEIQIVHVLIIQKTAGLRIGEISAKTNEINIVRYVVAYLCRSKRIISTQRIDILIPAKPVIIHTDPTP